MFKQEVQIESSCYQNKYTITIILVDFYKWKIVTTNGVCIDRWYVMIIFSCLARTACVDIFRWVVRLFKRQF